MGAGITPIQSMTSLICRADLMSCPWVGGKKAWNAEGSRVGEASSEFIMLDRLGETFTCCESMAKVGMRQS